MLRIVAFALASLSLAACATASEPKRPSDELVAKVTADAAAQVKRCYRSPRVLGEGRRITTRLAVRYAPDGSIVGLPVVVSQTGITPGNAIFAGAMAQAAIESVVRCSPLHLPPELYAFGWNAFELTFSPALRG